VNSRQSTVDGRQWWVVAVVAIVALALWSGDADACSVCFDPKEQKRAAFMITTILLTSLPLVGVFGVILWLRKLAASSDNVAPPPAE